MAYFEISELVGQTFTKIVKCTIDNNDALIFFSTGLCFMFTHEQECCESVSIEDINGDLNDLINTPIIKAEEVTNEGETDYEHSETWTFYKFATKKGYVTIRWYGTSNGYYSEKVDMYKISEEKANRIINS